jgi:hypothetical protein
MQPTESDWQAFNAARDEWTALAYLRAPGHTDDAVLSALRALSCSLSPGETQIALYIAIESIEAQMALDEEAVLWEADDKACRRAGDARIEVDSRMLGVLGSAL